MIDLWYLNTGNIDQEEVKASLQSLPQQMISEIGRFKNHEDRRLKLFGRLLVRKYFEERNIEFNWSEWCIAHDGKPYYKGVKKFNISHSGEYVAVAFSEQEIGADIEEVAHFDVKSISHYFHPEEAEHIIHSSDPNEAFFKLWTRKESFLKAIGKGIIEGLHNENCLPDKLVKRGTWHLHSLTLIQGYHMSLCTQIPECNINVREVRPNEFKN